MKLSDDKLSDIHYFFQLGSVTEWENWDQEKENVLAELPLLGEFLKKERELMALRKAVYRQIADYKNQTTNRSDNDALTSRSTVLPVTPPDGLLHSMAVRFDHGLGCPGFYDQDIYSQSGKSHKERYDNAIQTMSQLYEEVSGHGFFKWPPVD